MNEAFDNLLTSRLTDLTKDLLFDYKPDKSQVAPQIVQTMFLKKDRDHIEGQEFPFVRCAIFEGAFDARRPAPFSVIITGGIYTAGTVVDGTRDITSLAVALGKIVDKRAFPPYKLLTPVPFSIGSTEKGSEGIQSHPYYWLTMQLQFLVP